MKGKNMKVLFCSSIFNIDEYDKLSNKSKVALSLADHNLNKNFITGLDAVLDSPVKLINNVPIPNFPKFPQLFFKAQKWSHITKANDIHCGFINVPIIKHISRYISTYRQLKKNTIANGSDNVFVIVYDLHWGINKAVAKLKRKYPLIHISVILPDIPNAVLIASGGGKVTTLGKIYAKIKMRFIKNYDSYVFISKYMDQIVDVKNKKFVVIEGIYNNEQTFLRDKDREEKVILYSGQLNPAYGLNNLLEAFVQIYQADSHYRLWICGDGALKEKIVCLEEECPGVKYYGYVNTEKIRELQSQATVLINPRQNIGELTKYSFPSKTMEYLASGKPVVGYRLDGIPEEYYNYIQTVEDNTVISLKNKLMEICSLTKEERLKIGQNSRDFILKEKNPQVLCNKIIKMWMLEEV